MITGPGKDISAKKELFYVERKTDLVKIDKKILDFNLHCPTFRQGRRNLDIVKEMEQITAEVENIITGHQKAIIWCISP